MRLYFSLFPRQLILALSLGFVLSVFSVPRSLEASLGGAELDHLCQGFLSSLEEKYLGPTAWDFKSFRFAHRLKAFLDTDYWLAFLEYVMNSEPRDLYYAQVWRKASVNTNLQAFAPRSREEAEYLTSPARRVELAVAEVGFSVAKQMRGVFESPDWQFRNSILSTVQNHSLSAFVEVDRVPSAVVLDRFYEQHLPRSPENPGGWTLVLHPSVFLPERHKWTDQVDKLQVEIFRLLKRASGHKINPNAYFDLLILTTVLEVARFNLERVKLDCWFEKRVSSGQAPTPEAFRAYVEKAYLPAAERMDKSFRELARWTQRNSEDLTLLDPQDRRPELGAGFQITDLVWLDRD